MDLVEGTPSRSKIPKWLIPAVGYTISAVSLIWVFSKFPYAELGAHLRTLDWWWVTAAITFELLAYFADAWRWQLLLRNGGAPSFGVCLQSVFVGLFANDVLPARAGEVIRCFLLSFKSEVPLSLAVTSEIIERIMDGLWMVILYLLISAQISSHTMVDGAMWVFAPIVLAISALLLLVLFRRQHAHNFASKSKFAAKFVHLLDEVHRLGDWKSLGAGMAVSALYWVLQVFAVLALARADAFDFGFSAAAFLLVVKTMGTMIPNAPANVGLYQATAVAALKLLLVEHGNALIFAQIMFWFLTLPLVVGGAIAIGFAGLSLGDLSRQAHAAHKTARQPAP